MKTHMSRFVFALALIAPLAYVGCNYTHNKQSDGGAPINKLSPDSVPDFKEVNDRIFTAYHCSECHAARGEFNPSSYDEAIANLADIRAAVLPGARKPMPPNGPMDKADISFLLSWIDNGAPKDKLAPGATPAPTPVATPVPTATPVQAGALPSYAQLKTAILGPKCFICHDGVSDPDAVDLQSYADFSSRSKSIRKRIKLLPTEHGHMPEVGDNPQLTQAELDLLVSWIDGGAPENGVGQFQMPEPAPTIPLPVPSASPQPVPQPTAAPVPQPSPQPSPEPKPEPKPSNGELLPTFSSLNANLFMVKCMPCHAPEKKPGQKFPLTDLAGLIAHDADAITRKDSVHSKLIIAVTRTDEDRMPKAPREALTQAEVDTLKRWIELGCPP